MIITCQNCECRFRVDDNKVPSGSFTVACPKCQTTTSASSLIDVSDNAALGMGKSPSTSNPRSHRPRPAPVFRMEPNDESQHQSAAQPANSANDLALSL